MARPRLAVVDASVVAKWLLDEPDTDAALLLRRGHIEGEVHLTAPDFIIFEVANALRYHPDARAEAVAEQASSLLDLGIGLDVVSDVSIREAVHQAFMSGLTLYDAAYVALARRLHCPLYTADEVQLRAAGPVGRHVRTHGGGDSV